MQRPPATAKHLFARLGNAAELLAPLQRIPGARFRLHTGVTPLACRKNSRREVAAGLAAVAGDAALRSADAGTTDPIRKSRRASESRDR